MKPSKPSPVYITRKQAAEMLSVSEQTLANWAVTTKDLSFTKIGKMVRYRLADVENLLKCGTRG